MRFTASMLTLALVAAVHVGEADAADGLAPRRQLSLEAVPVAAALAFALGVAPNTSVGIKLGLGLDLLSLVPIAGGHFTDDWGLSYEARDGTTSKRYGEIAQVGLFVRHFLPDGFQLETGGRLAGGLHSDSSHDGSAGATFMGAYGALFWGSSILSIGSCVSVGFLSEPRDLSSEREVAVVVNPIILRLTTR
jgi:hypothetical protein